MNSAPRLGLKENWRQFSLLVVVNAFVGAMVGLERTVMPLLAKQDFAVASASVLLSFIVAFGVVKALSNLFAGALSDRVGRKPLLVAGWLAAVPVAPMIIWAPNWGWVIAANVLLGVNQGLAWSSTVIMKIDLAGPRRRGLAMGINEVAGYGALAVMAWVTAALATTYGPRPAPFVAGIVIALTGLVLSVVFVKETRAHALHEAKSVAPEAIVPFRRVFGRTSFSDRTLSAVCQAGLVNNLNDALAWGLLPVYLATRGLSLEEIGFVSALYPGAWVAAQIFTGAWSDRVGRKRLIAGGLWLQAAGISSMIIAESFVGWALAAVAIGLGTALVYPTLLAAVGDAAHPSWRAAAVGVYRLWRDLGYAVGALIAGVLADLFGLSSAIVVVSAITAFSGLVVALRMRETHIRSERELRVIVPSG
jgi:MFS family permease